MNRIDRITNSESGVDGLEAGRRGWASGPRACWRLNMVGVVRGEARDV